MQANVASTTVGKQSFQVIRTKKANRLVWYFMHFHDNHVCVLTRCSDPLGLVQRSGLVLVAAVGPPVGPCLSNHCPVPDLAQRPLGTPPPRLRVLLSELDPTAPWILRPQLADENQSVHPCHRVWAWVYSET